MKWYLKFKPVRIPLRVQWFLAHFCFKHLAIKSYLKIPENKETLRCDIKYESREKGDQGKKIITTVKLNTVNLNIHYCRCKKIQLKRKLWAKFFFFLVTFYCLGLMIVINFNDLNNFNYWWPNIHICLT